MERLYTRFIFTPTGPAHIGHAFTARINYYLARRTGGDWYCGIEDLLAMQSLWYLREAKAPGYETAARAWARENIYDLEWLGLQSNGAMVMYQSDRKQLVDWYYKLFGDERDFGPWPPEWSDGLSSNTKGIYLGLPAIGMEHPYVVLSRVVSDIITGRNLVLRGKGLERETGLYRYFAEKICAGYDGITPPELAYIPEIRRAGAGVLSSAAEKATAGWFIADVRAAGRTATELHQFLDWATMTAEARENARQWFALRKGPQVEKASSLMSTVAGAAAVFAALVDKDEISIDDDDWFRFLETGEVGE